MVRLAAVVGVALVLGACGDERPTAGTQPAASEPSVTEQRATEPSVAASFPIDSLPGTTTMPDVTTTSAAPTTSAPDPTVVSTTAPAPEETTAPVEATPYVVPVADVAGSGWGDTHSAYPATDIFNNGCGGTIVSPVNGELLEVRRINSYDPAIDNPATRGGRSISILGDDGVRYYLAHFELIDDGFAPGGRVEAGQSLGTIGSTGRSSACHLHFGISPPCEEREWSVRRGVIWPYRYLDDWRAGGQASPADEVAAFVAAQPDACAVAAADEFAADS